jgi:O-antigen/teichoic acid export membrane protein
VTAREADNRLGQQAVTAVLWTAAQKWLMRIGGFVTVAVLARLLAPADFGTVAVATAVLPIAYLLADMGFTMYVVQVDELQQRTLSTAFWFSSAAGLVLSGGLYLAAPACALLFHVPDSVSVVRALAPAVLLVSVTSVPIALMRRRLEFRLIAIQSVIGSIVGQVAAVTLAVAGAGVWALVTQSLLYQLVVTVLAWNAVRWRPGFLFSRHELGVMASFGFKVTGVDLVGLLREWAEAAIVAAALGVTGLGYLNVAQRLVIVARDVTAAAVLPVSTVVFARVRSDPLRLRSAYERALGFAYTAIVPAMVFLIVSAPYLMPMVFGDQWGPSIRPAQVLAAVTILTLAAMLDQGLFTGLARPGRWFLYAVVVDVLTVGVAAFTAPHGLVAWCYGFLVVAVGATAVRWPLLQRIAGIPWRVLASALLRAAVCAVVAGLAGWAVATAAAGLPPVVVVGLCGVAVLGTQLAAMCVVMRRELADTTEIVRARLERVQTRLGMHPGRTPEDAENVLAMPVAQSEEPVTLAQGEMS